MISKFYTRTIGVILFILLYVACDDDTNEINTSRLETLIVEATEAASEAEEGPEPGLYPVGSTDLLQTYIDSATTVMQTSVSQFGVDLAELFLDDALEDFTGSIQVEQQVYFDGDGYLDGGLATDFNTPQITISAWAYPTEWKNAMYLISTEGKQTGYKLQLPGGKAIFQMGVDGSSVVNVQAADAMNLDEWTHVAATFNGTKLKLYVNGVLAGEKDLAYEITDNGENFRVGEGSKYTGRTFQGRIRDVRVWSKALSDEEIAASMTNTLKGTEEGLTACWPLNLSAGSTIYDRTGNHALTMVNANYVDPL